MTRRRRSAAEARDEILAASEELLLSEGPDAVRLKRVAERVGMSHPGVLHHFGSVDQLLEALSQRTSRAVREDLLSVLQAGSLTGPGARGAVSDALARIADPQRGRLLAWLVASGRDPFPPVVEQGLLEIVKGFQTVGDANPDEVAFAVQLGVLASLGDALFGSAVRQRLGGDGEASGAAAFRAQLLKILGPDRRGG